MKNVKSLVFSGFVAVTATFVMSGCSALQETFASQMEVPTVEVQSNRAAIGMTIVRENNVMAFKMPISSGAKWPAAISAEMTPEQKKKLEKILEDNPYFATVHYTKLIQRKMLGSGALVKMAGDLGNVAASALDQTISPLTYRAANKLSVLYGDDKKNWPDLLSFDGSLKNFLDFKDGYKLKTDSLKGDVYKTIGEAVSSLAPVNMQKNLISSNSELLDAYSKVASVKSQKGELETKLQTDSAKAQDKVKNPSYVPFTEAQKEGINKEMAVIDQQIKEAESFADEKEKIYFSLLDQAVIALESDINVDDMNYVNLARNVNIVSNEIKDSAIDAYAAFGLATTNILANNSILNFPKELASLAVAKANVPLNMQDKYNDRVAKLVQNAIHLLPNILIGTYYANKQSTLAGKYESFTKIIITAYDKKKEQEKAADKDAKALEQKEVKPETGGDVKTDAEVKPAEQIQVEPAVEEKVELKPSVKAEVKTSTKKSKKSKKVI
ncbi:hypothetical protein [Sulfurimonas sp.]|uniref:hypothetical protein n=1 Tax=Sulfurimonas sp. TaxID=2022749 RepID=UPI0025FBB36F|nr:hypothetical protein [Sulfurimonas sp.]MDD5158200.1 hypothetical protein [Sulfurimonas sp.]